MSPAPRLLLVRTTVNRFREACIFSRPLVVVSLELPTTMRDAGGQEREEKDERSGSSVLYKSNVFVS